MSRTKIVKPVPFPFEASAEEQKMLSMVTFSRVNLPYQRQGETSSKKQSVNHQKRKRVVTTKPFCLESCAIPDTDPVKEWVCRDYTSVNAYSFQPPPFCDICTGIDGLLPRKAAVMGIHKRIACDYDRLMHSPGNLELFEDDLNLSEDDEDSSDAFCAKAVNVSGSKVSRVKKSLFTSISNLRMLISGNICKV